MMNEKMNLVFLTPLFASLEAQSDQPSLSALRNFDLVVYPNNETHFVWSPKCSKHKAALSGMGGIKSHL